MHDSGHAMFQMKDQSLWSFIIVVVAAFCFQQLLNVGKFYKKYILYKKLKKFGFIHLQSLLVN